MKSRIVGTQFKQYAPAKEFKEGVELLITHDINNKNDDKALCVSFNCINLGYIPKSCDLYDADRNLFPMTAKVVDFYIREEEDVKFKNHHVGFLVSCNIEVEDIVELDPSNNVKSFNEEGVVINFDEDSHTYTNPLNNNILIGATTYSKMYYHPFSSFALDNCVKYWGLERKLIKSAWDLGRDLSALFGSAIHKALEFSDLYGSYKKPKDGVRCFNIKHPVIKNIVEDFYILNDKLGFIGDIVPEALITDVENNHCALADRVLVTSWSKKHCRLQDYKVNIKFTEKGECKWTDLMPLDLPTTKLSKLALQLKFQSQMLEKNGWTIQGCDGFVFAENGWEHHEVDMLAGFDIIKGTYNQNLIDL